MNILEAEDMVKGLPDQVLFQYAQNPPPNIPQYLAVSEVQRRQDMRQRFQSQQQGMEPSVKDQILQGGIASAGGMPPEEMPMEGPPMEQGGPPMGPPQGPPQGMPQGMPMYRGGITRMAEGGLTGGARELGEAFVSRLRERASSPAGIVSLLPGMGSLEALASLGPRLRQFLPPPPPAPTGFDEYFPSSNQAGLSLGNVVHMPADPNVRDPESDELDRQYQALISSQQNAMYAPFHSTMAGFDPTAGGTYDPGSQVMSSIGGPGNPNIPGGMSRGGITRMAGGGLTPGGIVYMSQGRQVPDTGSSFRAAPLRMSYPNVLSGQGDPVRQLEMIRNMALINGDTETARAATQQLAALVKENMSVFNPASGARGVSQMANLVQDKSTGLGFVDPATSLIEPENAVASASAQQRQPVPSTSPVNRIQNTEDINLLVRSLDRQGVQNLFEDALNKGDIGTAERIRSAGVGSGKLDPRVADQMFNQITRLRDQETRAADTESFLQERSLQAQQDIAQREGARAAEQARLAARANYLATGVEPPVVSPAPVPDAAPAAPVAGTAPAGTTPGGIGDLQTQGTSDLPPTNSNVMGRIEELFKPRPISDAETRLIALLEAQQKEGIPAPLDLSPFQQAAEQRQQTARDEARQMAIANALMGLGTGLVAGDPAAGLQRATQMATETLREGRREAREEGRAAEALRLQAAQQQRQAQIERMQFDREALTGIANVVSGREKADRSDMLQAAQIYATYNAALERNTAELRAQGRLDERSLRTARTAALQRAQEIYVSNPANTVGKSNAEIAEEIRKIARMLDPDSFGPKPETGGQAAPAAQSRPPLGSPKYQTGK